MYTTIKNKYGEAESYAQPVVSQPIPRDIFMGYVREAVDKMYVRVSVTRNNFRMRTNILEHYLNKYGINEVNPNEQFIKEMWNRLKENGEFEARDYQWGTRKKVPQFTREIINDFFFSKGLVQRKILKDIVCQRYEKFFELTPNSREAVKWYEENGKGVEAKPVYFEDNGDTSNHSMKMIQRITNKDLKPLTKNGKVEHALRFLKAVNKNGFEFITIEDVKKYEEICSQRGVKQKQDYLAHVATFFINIKSKGFIKTNPLSHVSLKMNGGAIKKDFISIEGMEKLRDLSTLDYKNKIDVRDRLFVLLGYDLALRISELLNLEVSNFRKDDDGEWIVTLKHDIQKGYKDEIGMLFLFEETKQLLEYYLKVTRKEFAPTSDFLILSNQRGGKLCADGCATRFKELCQRFGVQTYNGKSPSPHTLRHTFATLNIESIGLGLSLYEMAQRLRHSKVETTRKHYIHNNPYLEKIKIAALRKNNKKKTPNDVLNEMPIADLEHWFSDKLAMDSVTIRHIRDSHKKAFCETPVDKNEVDNRIFIPESDAILRLNSLKIPLLALRKHALKEKAIKQGENGSCRYGNGFHYKESFIEDLIQNWVPVEKLKQKFGKNKDWLYRALKDEKWRTLKIGRMRFVHRLDCV
jgi:integrase